MFWKSLVYHRIMLTVMAIPCIWLSRLAVKWLAIKPFGIEITFTIIAIFLIWSPEKLWIGLNNLLGTHPVWCYILTGFISGLVVTALLIK